MKKITDRWSQVDICHARMREKWDIYISLNLAMLLKYETIIITTISIQLQ